MKLFLKIKYDGSRYGGYQVQKNAVTVQQKLNEATQDLFGFDCDIVGCSRTDAGVHAECFCLTVAKKGEDSLVSSLPCEKVPRALNVRLPSDIAVYEARWVGDDFHARYGVREKTYVYRILNSPERDPFYEKRAWHCPRPISESDVRAMRAAAVDIVGKHDFSAFMASGSSVKSTVRTVTRVDVLRRGDLIEIYVGADGFLYNMVRIIAGTLLDVARGRIPEGAIAEIIDSRDRSRAGVTAPAEGLYLWDVKY